MNRPYIARWIPLAAILCLALPVPLIAAEGTVYDPDLLEQMRDRIKAGEFVKVEEEGRAILLEVEREEGAESLAAADVISVIVQALRYGPQPGAPESIALAERGVTINEARVGPVHLGVARAVNDLAVLYYYAGDYDAALPHLERSLAIRQELLGPDSDVVARGLNNIGTLLYSMGDIPAALVRLHSALEILERTLGPESERVGMALENIGIFNVRMGDLREAMRFFDRAEVIFEKLHGPEHPFVAGVLNGKAAAANLMGDYAGAQVLYERSLTIRQNLPEPNQLEVAQTHTNLAILAYTIGDMWGALEHAELAVAVYTERLGADHPETTRFVNTYGTVLDAVGQTDQAIEVMEGNLIAREKALGPEHYDVAESQSALAVMYRERGDAEKALPLLQQALATREKSLGSDHPTVAVTLSDLAKVKSDLGADEEARELFEHALAIREARLGAGHPQTAASLVDLAEFDWDRGERGEVLERSRRAAAILRASARETLAVLPERKALLLVANQVHPEEILFSGLLASGVESAPWIEACWEWSLGRRGLVLEELAVRHRSVLAEESEEARLAWEKLAEARRELASLWVAGVEGLDPETYRDDLDKARRGKESAESELARLSGSFRREQRDRQASLSELTAALPARSALVEWVRVRAGRGKSEERKWRDVALVVTAGGKTGFIDLGESEAIDSAIALWRAALEGTAHTMETDGAGGATGDGATADAMRGLRLAGEQLRHLIWDPLPAGLREADRLFLIPDGALHQVDLAALPAKDGGYLIESGPAIHLLSSGRDLVRIARGGEDHEVQGKGLLVLGDPDFDADRVARQGEQPEAAVVIAYRGPTSECLAVAGTTWRPLPESGREVRQVSELFGGDEPVAALTGAAASEERFKRDAPGHRVLHLATHGFFLAGDCAEGAAGEEAMTESPLLLSGLVLAGANRTGDAGEDGDDGILTAEELAALDLRGVDLAVLSACDTGRGEVAVGEGVFGLRRALEIAGVRTVVMSLWPIPDRQARRWMNTFYKDRREGTSISEASRQAALANLNELRERELPDHPYHWAGIVAAGDWRWSR